jgi:hypothetical protein
VSGLISAWQGGEDDDLEGDPWQGVAFSHFRGPIPDLTPTTQRRPTFSRLPVKRSACWRGVGLAARMIGSQPVFLVGMAGLRLPSGHI